MRNRVADFTRTVYLDRAKMSDTTVLLSSGRSGSTWLSAMLQSLPATRTIFEPFHPAQGIPELSDHRYTYHEPGKEVPDLQRLLERTISGDSRTVWTDRFNPVGRFVFRRRLIKEVRINLLFPWFSNCFPDCKYILLLRHPAAVVSSQVREGWDLNAARLLEQPGILDTLSLEASCGKAFSRSVFYRNLLFWAVENAVALKYAMRCGALVLFYEELCVSPREQLSKIERFLGQEFPSAVHEQLDRTSWSSKRGVGERSAQQKIESWKKDLEEHHVRAIEEAVRICGFPGLYGQDLMPDSDLVRTVS